MRGSILVTRAVYIWHVSLQKEAWHRLPTVGEAALKGYQKHAWQGTAQTFQSGGAVALCFHG